MYPVDPKSYARSSWDAVKHPEKLARWLYTCTFITGDAVSQNVLSSDSLRHMQHSELDLLPNESRRKLASLAGFVLSSHLGILFLYRQALIMVYSSPEVSPPKG